MNLKCLLTSVCVAFLGLSAAAKDPDTLVFSFQKQKKPEELQATSEKLAQVLSQELGKKIQVVVPTTYASTVQGLISNKVHVAYMDSLPYLLTKKEKAVEIIAVEKRNGRTDYDSLLVVRKDSPINALSDLKGKKVAFTSQTSTSGYLMPFSRLISEKQVTNPDSLPQYFSQILYAGGYDKALQSVISGQTQVAAFSDYVIEGKKADIYGTQSERDQVRVLARTSGVPTHLVAVSSDLSTELKQKIQSALLKAVKNNPDLISSVYGAAELVLPPKNPEDHIRRTVQALKDTGLDAKVLVK